MYNNIFATHTSLRLITASSAVVFYDNPLPDQDPLPVLIIVITDDGQTHTLTRSFDSLRRMFGGRVSGVFLAGMGLILEAIEQYDGAHSLFAISDACVTGHPGFRTVNTIHTSVITDLHDHLHHLARTIFEVY